MEIKGPNGKSLVVNEEYQAEVNGVYTELEMHTNLEHMECYSVDVGQTPTGPGDCFYVLQNTGSSEVVVTEFVGNCVVGDDIYFVVGPNGVPAGGAAIAAVNKYVGSGHAPVGLVSYGGANVVGLIAAAVIDRFGLPAAAPPGTKRWSSGIALKPGHEIAIYATTGTNPIIGSLHFFINVHPA